jgi:hypothetical protein
MVCVGRLDVCAHDLMFVDIGSLSPVLVEGERQIVETKISIYL